MEHTVLVGLNIARMKCDRDKKVKDNIYCIRGPIKSDRRISMSWMM
jgi:hypothetical protein